MDAAKSGEKPLACNAAHAASAVTLKAATSDEINSAWRAFSAATAWPASLPFSTRPLAVATVKKSAELCSPPFPFTSLSRQPLRCAGFEWSPVPAMAGKDDGSIPPLTIALGGGVNQLSRVELFLLLLFMADFDVALDVTMGVFAVGRGEKNDDDDGTVVDGAAVFSVAVGDAAGSDDAVVSSSFASLRGCGVPFDDSPNIS